jgi:hypothetical protein
VDLYELRIEDCVRTIDGAIVEIINETQDGEWILVRYLESADNQKLVGTEDLCHQNELTELVGSDRSA